MSDHGNILILCSDQHRRGTMGCSGNPLIDTPNLDALARSGTRFAHAYCNAPICVPSRASIATGLQIHDIPSWDNADPYHGQRSSFMHRCRGAGVHTASIGKLHFRDTEDDTGFDEQILPMHVIGGTGTFYSVLRDPVPRIRAGCRTLETAGPGETEYTAYDTSIAEAAEAWIAARAASRDTAPFLLNVSFVNPHPPYVAPQELYEKYLARDLPAPMPEDWNPHPSLDGIRQYFDTEEPLTPDAHKKVIAAYYANVEFLDQNVGRVLAALNDSGLARDTLILYISDHGDTLGEAGLYGKCSMFEGSVGVPLIMAGPGVPAGAVTTTAAQLLDIYPTVIEALGAEPADSDKDRSGKSLLKIARSAPRERWILIQDHCAGSVSATFALTDGRIKYVHHLDFDPMLFDLEADPLERCNLASDPDYQDMLAGLKTRLFEMVDPLAIDRACRASQEARAATRGGFDGIMARVRSSAHTPPPSPK